MANKESTDGTKQSSWRLSLVFGVSLVSLCLSIICIAYFVFLPKHTCECTIHKPVEYSPTRPENQQSSDEGKSHGSVTEYGKPRERRNIGSTNDIVAPIYQLQRQLMLLEARVRFMQEEIFKRRSTPGPRGPAGVAGRPGRNGLDGRPGMDGPMGMPGRDGTRGKDGNTGPPGAPGPPGVNGLMGPQGQRGMKGLKGAMGDKGDRGLPGPKGDRGPAGLSGESGEPGTPGRMGRKGEKGDKGGTTCYVTKRGRRYIQPCYLASLRDNDNDDAQNQQPRATGLVYTRWGRTTCPSGGARAIYGGQAASTSHGKGRMGGSSYECIPTKPWYFGQRTQSDALRNSSSRLNPQQETDLLASYFYLSCAKCLVKTRSIHVMLPARKECYPGWYREYDGFLGVQINRKDHKKMICIDRDAHGIFSASDYIQALRADCASFPCPPYSRGERLPCVVCTM